MTLKIGQLAALAGTTTPTIRYYEQIGMLPRPNRRQSGQRCYAAADVARLKIILQCRAVGLSLEQTRHLLSLMDDSGRSCADARTVAHTHLTDIRARLADLKAQERRMRKFIANCNRACTNGPAQDCVVLRDLAAEKVTHAVPRGDGKRAFQQAGLRR